MRYLGGKTRLKKYLVPIIDQYRRPGQLAWDAFCGGLAMSEALSARGPVLASDAHPALISLYQAIRGGWIPPESISRDEWVAAKALPDSDPMKGFAGFGCSFGGMYFSSYAPPEAQLTVGSGPSAGNTFRRRYHGATGDVLRRQIPKIHAFAEMNFLQTTPGPLDAVIYCDPPYAGTLGYSGLPTFDTPAFHAKALAWSAFCPVFISEYACPIGTLVFEMPAPRGCTMAKASATERLYLVQPNDPPPGTGPAPHES